MPASTGFRSPQYSTAISDGVLGLMSIAMAWNVWMSNYLCAAVGFMLVAAAASLGVVRFSMTWPPAVLIDWHQYMSWQAGAAGVPLVAASYLHHHNTSAASLLVFLAVAIIVLRNRILSANLCESAGNILGPASLVAILIIGFLTINGFAIVGTLLFVVAGLIVKTEGQIGMFPRVDIFHYLLTLANIALMKGLALYGLPPIYYRS